MSKGRLPAARARCDPSLGFYGSAVMRATAGAAASSSSPAMLELERSQDVRPMVLGEVRHPRLQGTDQVLDPRGRHAVSFQGVEEPAESRRTMSDLLRRRRTEAAPSSWLRSSGSRMVS